MVFMMIVLETTLVCFKGQACHAQRPGLLVDPSAQEWAILQATAVSKRKQINVSDPLNERALTRSAPVDKVKEGDEDKDKNNDEDYDEDEDTIRIR